jgi:LTXXQ motif family protein
VWQSSVCIATVMTLAFAGTAAPAQGRPGGFGGMRAAPAAPRFAAPAAPRFTAPAAPRFAAPRFGAPVAPRFAAPVVPHFAAPALRRFPVSAPSRFAAPAAPRFSVPRVAPQIAMPHIAPRIATVPRMAAPKVTAPAPSGGRSLAQPLHERGAGSAFAHVASNPTELAARGPGTAFVRVVPNLTRPNQGVQTILPAGDNRPFAARALTSRAFANRVAGSGGKTLAHRTFQGAFVGRHFNHFRRRFFPVVIGWLGPWFWPYAYDDFLDYTFYPYAYDTFWPYAYNDLYQGLFGPYAYNSGSANTYVYGSATTYAAIEQPEIQQPEVQQPATEQPSSGGGVTRAGGTRLDGADLCSGSVGGLTNWPIERIAQTVEPDDTQRVLLDDVKAATAQALETLKASCPTELPNTPGGRIEAMHARLVAMLQAVRTVRPPLEKFYQSLNDEQKARLNALGPEKEDQQQARSSLAQVCNQRAAGIAALPTERIEQVVRPDNAQRGALQELKDATAQAVNLLQSDCPTYRPLTVTGRVEVMEQRLGAMLRAVDLVQPALARFYGSLSDEQKERFNRLNPSQG